MANAITFYGKISLKIPKIAIYAKNIANAILITWQMLSKCLANAMFFYSICHTFAIPI